MLDKIEVFLEGEPILRNVISAVIIFSVAWLIQRFFVHLIRRGIKRTQSQKQKTYLSVMRKTIQFLVYVIAMMMIIEVFGFSSTPMVAIASAVSVSLGLGAQQFIRDLLSGFFILSENHFNLGDVVTINGVTGVVESITLRATRLRNSLTGEQYILSNGDINMVTNMSRDYRKAVVDFLVPYHFEMEHVINVLEKALDEIELEEPMITKPGFDGVTTLEERFYVLRVSCRTLPDKNWGVETMLRRRLVKSLRDENITLSSKTLDEVEEYNPKSEV